MPLNNPIIGAAMAYGTYTGNDAVDRAIPHGMAQTPKLIVIWDDLGTNAMCACMQGITGVLWTGDHTVQPCLLATSPVDSTNFYVGNATSQAYSANLAPRNYYWIAFG